MTITPAYAGILALLFIVLSVRVIGMRRLAGVGLGDGGNRTLLRRLRVHANFAEYVPLALILMTLAELQDAPDWMLHGLGLLLLAGRAAHACGASQEPERMRLRVLGMALTLAVLIAGALCNLAISPMALFGAAP